MWGMCSPTFNTAGGGFLLGGVPGFFAPQKRAAIPDSNKKKCGKISYFYIYKY